MLDSRYDDMIRERYVERLREAETARLVELARARRPRPTGPAFRLSMNLGDALLRLGLP